MKRLEPSRVAFGRHETFPLRFGWLTKGFQHWVDNPNVFEQQDATVALGVGKNMVSAIRYWMVASQVVEPYEKGLKPTSLGEHIFSERGWDPYLEDDTTIWLLHWLIASDPTNATAMFWFFNRFHKPEFTSREVLAALQDFAKENVKARAAASTLKHDVDVILRMYQRTAEEKGVPIEESLDSPMATLGLLSRSEQGKYYQSRPEFRRELPLAAFAYAVADLLDASGQASLSVDRILHSDGHLAAPGSVFRLSEDCLIAKLEELVAWLPKHFELRETAGINQLYTLGTGSLKQLDVLRRHYAKAQKLKEAA